MILTAKMKDVLNQLRRIESKRVSRIMDVPVSELGNCLIRVYYNTRKPRTRELIYLFMRDAGPVWQRKLLLGDAATIASSSSKFASMNDYLGLLVCNDNTFSAEAA